jgi:hypothetical protein
MDRYTLFYSHYRHCAADHHLVWHWHLFQGRGRVQSTRWLYDSKNKEEALSIHMKVLKAGRESAEEDYKYLVQDFQPFPRDGTISKLSYDKTMELRAQEGLYQGKKVPPMSEYVESSLIEEALKQIEK